jgi:hypothetical protein
MDETGLFWKMLVSRGLLSQSRPGLKKDKTCVSLALCVIATGTDRLPIWIIGKAKTPRALKTSAYLRWVDGGGGIRRRG